MKQARAYGLGIVLATQNPVDLDYKGLANAGLWFLGRLQTARDKARVLDGLEGAATSAGGSFDRARLDRLLSGLEQRRFLMHSVHGDDETLFQTRWTMSYLRGPLMREEIRRLAGDAPAVVASSPRDAESTRRGGPRPILPPGIKEVFVAGLSKTTATHDVFYKPHILARAIVRYSLASAGIEEHREQFYLAPAPTSLGESAWESAMLLPEALVIEPGPRAGSFAPLPAVLAGPRGYAALAPALKNFLARSSKLTAWRAPALGEVSRPEESERDFRLRIAHRARERRDDEIEKLRSRAASKLATLEDRIERARQKVEREKAQAKDQSMQTYVSIGSAVLDALLGRRKFSSRTIGKAATSMRSASRATRQQADVAHAEESLQTLEDRRRELETEIDRDLEAIRLAWSPEALAIEPIEIPARKTDTTVEDVVLAWVPT
jgi:hypothetical protein